ncbi:hypothetical protein H072_2118 [Dactylellina haptotyla CBS 200.50]|uniref:Methyltransferase type 11 domain-containing protein n=1 Tax=Dactylellina haptotyla (strain CBS 200.50) TaxID=1284197 RepID=S8BWQ1_DACHA|nr:hypothetical protein H072_2118 [Dactylellina haptotyla CBS 200.50]
MAPPKKKDFKGFSEWDSQPKQEAKPRASSKVSKNGTNSISNESSTAPTEGSKRTDRRPLPGMLGNMGTPRSQASPTTAPKVASSSRPPPRPGQKYPNIVLGDQKRPDLTPAQKIKRVKGIYWITGLGVYALSSYGVYLYIQYGKAVKLQEENEREYSLGLKHRPEVDTNKVYEKISGNYDSSVRFSEWFMGMSLLRRWMLWGLEGDILEASAGTGRNNPYYHAAKCRSITMVDNSPKMLEIAKTDFQSRYPHYGHISFAAQDASQPIKSPSGEGFDRVIQTMGLCSQKSPVETLKNLEQHCRPGGKILLLEHGRSHYNWLNSILDAYVLDHARSWGCFWNRDIGKLLEESGLVVTKISRFHLGTTWLIEASPRPRKRTGTGELGPDSE